MPLTRVTTRAAIGTAAVLSVTAALAAGCGRAGGGTTSSPTSSSAASSTSSAAGTSAGDFGTLSDICHGNTGGGTKGGTDQGVTASSIEVGVLSDYGYTKDPQLLNAATVFTDWCNAQGGIDGRKLVADIHDTELMEVVSAMSKACASDFVLAGSSAALDGLAVDARLKCLLPDFDAEPIMPQNQGSGLQITPYTSNSVYSPYVGYYKWLLQKYPDSADHVGVLFGQSVITDVDDSMVEQTVADDGGKVAYNGSFPISGVTNWTPYAEAVKAKGIKGLTFYDTPQTLAAFEQALDNIGYHLDWIDANTNAYGTDFIQIDGKALTDQRNYADLPGIYPVEKAAANPAMTRLVQLFHQYAPGQPVTLMVEEAFSAWLIFAQSAGTCGADLTRSCVYNAAVKQTDWTAGGLTAPVDEATPLSAPECFDIEQATASGWEPAVGFTANTDGVYSCGQEPADKLTGMPAATQLSTVGESLSDLK